MKQHSILRIFYGATAIITGGASGIGRALAEELAKRGCEVILADLQIELAEKVAATIRSSGGNASSAKLDVTDFPSVERLCRETVKRTGRLDYLFNNAGIGIGGNVSHYGIADWNEIIDVNLRGVINGIQAAYQIMRKQGFGHIVNTASMAGLMPSPGNVAYAATKYAVVGLSKSLRAEAAQAGVRVSVLCPGVIRTPILEGGGKYGKMLVDIPPEQMRRMWEKLKPMSPDIFAIKVLNSVALNKAIIIVPSWWKLFWWIDRLFPSLGIVFAQISFQNMQKELSRVHKN
ncbi:MAG TPA: SDR family oxidoreductase [Nitrospirota bacterium]|nr:SDR family oxidoreductase [Nitrospirota bacterium]